jgi:hypothetical protein
MTVKTGPAGSARKRRTHAEIRTLGYGAGGGGPITGTATAAVNSTRSRDVQLTAIGADSHRTVRVARTDVGGIPPLTAGGFTHESRGSEVVSIDLDRRGVGTRPLQLSHGDPTTLWS